jgi:hypothetical protein
MAEEDVNPQTELPPQANQPLPAAAADAGGAEDQQVESAPTAANVVGPAAYGDKGWAQYQGLQAAGRQAPAPAVPTPATPQSTLPGDPNASGLNYLLGGGGAAAPSPLMNLFGGPGTATKYQSGVMQQQQAVQKFQQQQQSMAIQGLDALDKMRTANVSPQVRVLMIQQLAASQGKPLTPAQAAYVDQLHNDPDLANHLLLRIRAGADPNANQAQKDDALKATADYNSLFSADPAKQINALSDIKKSSADADKAIADATTAQAKALAAPGEAASKATSAALEVASRLRSAQRPPTSSEVDVLDAAGLEAYQVPIPGVKDGTMWSTRPKAPGVTPGTISAEGMRTTKAQTKAEEAGAKEAATTSGSTRTMQEAAPGVLTLAQRAEQQMKALESKGIGVGPGASRWRDLWAGKVGTPDPDFIAFKDNVDLLATKLMRMHAGARGTEFMVNRFDGMIGAGHQAPENMQAAFDQIKTYANDILSERKNVPGAEAGPQPRRITSQAEFDALPSKATFINPADGRVLTKP